MTREQARRNIKLYYAYTMIKEPLFWGAILVELIMRVSLMSLTEVYFMESACIIISIFLEIPTGALADHIGRKKTIIIGNTLLVVMMLIFSFCSSKPSMWIADIIGFAGYTFISGADTALLFDSLKFLGREEDHRKIVSRAGTCKYLLVAICSLGTGYMAGIDLRFPLYACIPFLMFSWILVWKFTESPYAGRDRYDGKKHLQLMKDSFVFVIGHARVIWAISFIVLVATVCKLWFFSYNPYFSHVGLDYKNFGYIFFGLNLVAAISSFLLPTIHRRIGNFGSIVLMIACMSVPLIAMGTFVVPMAAWLVLVQNVIRGYFDPFMNDFLQRYLDSRNRATVLSVKSATSSVGQFFALMGFGAMLGIWPLPNCLTILGLTALLGGVVLIVAYRKVFVT